MQQLLSKGSSPVSGDDTCPKGVAHGQSPAVMTHLPRTGGETSLWVWASGIIPRKGSAWG